MSKVKREDKPKGDQANALRRGWTTGACATAATKSALTALLTGDFIDPVEIELPKGDIPSFALAQEKVGDGFAEAGIVKDAGDDPDVTHGATIISRVTKGPAGSGVRFRAGSGVGTVTKSGLPIAVGEAAINPVPRKLMTSVVEEICMRHKVEPDIEITLSVPEGEKIAERTWNPRLGILGGISILGTTGVVHPFSCSAWIHSIHRGIDVARAEGLTHVLGATGSTSETAANKVYNFEEIAMLDMGDFVGGLLKYLRQNPIDRITLAGGFAKFTKLAQGAMDLHSGRSQVDFEFLSRQAQELGLPSEQTSRILSANTAMEVLELTQAFSINMPKSIAELAQENALAILRGAPVEVEVMIFARDGKMLARTDWRS
ncbi:MAG: cobalt-precorrin-5B (C(1))-methyltransferase [Rhizobiaceae bacterium]|nr:cobalt-precorrin-5B (C(1))-methyltransferase [Rhizobiaceae bacterium]